MTRRFPATWSVEQIPGGFKVIDATGQALAYVYARDTAESANVAKELTRDEARRFAANIAKLPELFPDYGHLEALPAPQYTPPGEQSCKGIRKDEEPLGVNGVYTPVGGERHAASERD